MGASRPSCFPRIRRRWSPMARWPSSMRWRWGRWQRTAGMGELICEQYGVEFTADHRLVPLVIASDGSVQGVTAQARSFAISFDGARPTALDRLALDEPAHLLRRWAVDVFPVLALARELRPRILRPFTGPARRSRSSSGAWSTHFFRARKAFAPPRRKMAPNLSMSCRRWRNPTIGSVENPGYWPSSAMASSARTPRTRSSCDIDSSPKWYRTSVSDERTCSSSRRSPRRNSPLANAPPVVTSSSVCTNSNPAGPSAWVSSATPRMSSSLDEVTERTIQP